MTDCIKVSIVDDDYDFSSLLKSYLDKQDGIKVISTFHSKETAIKDLPLDNPDVILMDINLGDNNLDGIDLTKELIKKTKINSKIIMLTGISTSREVVLDSINAGAAAYLLKANIQSIPHEIKSVMSASPISIIADAYRNEKTNSLLHSLSFHQLMHIKMIFDKKSCTEIAKELSIELSTVKKNLTRIYKLLNVKSRYELKDKFNKDYLDNLIKIKMK
ncbi:response regulator transcription factor [Acetivibrio straminisolvens]|jgi:DNA-binding NarL/FixJ family response regulator|uniref:Stage 0 sporulation protein A homolog n=1 Tax=Acetivibrio straminisolvens JCM 21531 TaxID=1294263 RepID=W4VE12_9FIRM|nr:response regulator transcription factor [Acetivibrio straminisolvens]GAE90989.1 nitrate/nitrite response regulator protein [Acetivibrio straminisolvens JCM 21531]